MNLDPRTLLFSLILTNALMVLSLFVTTRNSGKRDGLDIWATAVLLETCTWVMIASRGLTPDFISIVVANGFKAGTHALYLAAISTFQRRSVPRWQYYAPVALSLLVAWLLIDDLHGRFVWGGLIYAFQIALLARTLWTDAETRSGRAWRLLFGGLLLILLVLALRAFFALAHDAGQLSLNFGMAPHWVQVVSFIAITATTLLGSIGFILMVKERTDREILQLAMTDSLTGVPNRRALLGQAEAMIARRNAGPVALLMIDVDHFKRINDSHGHPAGDEVLRQVTQLLSGRLRGGDVLGRYGGEEFCVVAPDTDIAGARALAEALRSTVAATPLRVESETITVTVSIGIAASTALELQTLLAQADAALYRAKAEGRNRIVCAPPAND